MFRIPTVSSFSLSPCPGKSGAASQEMSSNMHMASRLSMAHKNSLGTMFHSGKQHHSSRNGTITRGRRVQDPVVAPVILPSRPDEEAMDLNGHMLRNRVVLVGQRINDQVATQVVASLLALDSLDPKAEIRLYINCIAGSSYSVISILDTIAAISAPVSTVGFGMVGGSAVTILAAGQKGRRFCMPNTRIMLQQPNGGAMGSADEVNIQASELNRTMKVIYHFLSKYSGLSIEQVEQECDRENFLAPTEAVELGFIDGVVPPN